MKRYSLCILAVLVLFGCFSGCADKSAIIDNNCSISDNGKSDLNDDQNYLGTSIQRTIAEGPDAFYFVSADYLYYMDKQTYDTGILCGKPDCRHTEEQDYEKSITCGAWHTGVQSVVYYDNKLYLLELETNSIGTLDVVLNQYNLFGEFENRIAVLPTSVDSIIQHQGMAYYVYYDMDASAEEDDWGSVFLMSIDLSNGKQSQMATWPGTEVFSAGDSFVFDECLYLRVSYFENPHEFDMKTGYDIFNLKTGEHTRYQDEAVSLTTLLIYGDGLIYSKYEDEKDTDENDVLYASGKNFKNEKTAANIKYEDGQVKTFDNILLVSNRWTGKMNSQNPEMIAIYKDFKLIGEFSLYDIAFNDPNDGVENVAVCFSDIGKYIMVSVKTTASHGNIALVAFEKEKLVKGISEPVVLFEPKLAACYEYESQ